ncbi:MAG: DegT/DnrJ/EryC1/StrS family aminotransferase [Planctomycetota bacterium]
MTNRITLPSDQDATGRTFGPEELEAVRECLATGTLTSTKGNFVKQLETKFAARIGARYAYACSSGTAAVHCAVAALNTEPGDEIITTSITDMGAITPIIYQGAIPVFCDVDPHTYNVSAEAIARVINPRTRGIIVTHLFGNPCDMAPIMDLANRHGIPVIEDCAQAFLTTYRDQYAGTFGAVGSFSLQQGKHITTGEGGLVTTNDPAIARRIYLFINKAWGYGDAKPDHYFVAPNYRMSELLGAVALAQLDKLDAVVESRVRSAAALTTELAGLPGIETPMITENSVHTFWKYCLRVDEHVIPGGTVALGAALKDHGILCAPRYIQKPAFECQVIRNQVTFGTSRWPFTLARPEATDYSRCHFEGTWNALEHVLVLPWNEKYTDEHIQYLSTSIRNAVMSLTGKVAVG